MNKIVEELKKVKVFYVATTEGDQPRVRPFSSVAEFEGNAYICCGNFKEVYRQLTADPKVELCGMYEDGTSWLRVSATVAEDPRIEAQRLSSTTRRVPTDCIRRGTAGSSSSNSRTLRR